MKKIGNILKILGSLWIMYIFLWSLPYKFSGHEHTQFIFWTIWEWMKWILGSTIWEGFSNYGAFVIGGWELIISCVLIWAIYFTIRKQEKKSDQAFALWWIWAMLLMIWAVFFHLFTPLWIAVNGDGGSLFRAAVSIVIIWAILWLVHIKSLQKSS